MLNMVIYASKADHLFFSGKQVGVLGELETESAMAKKQELGAVSLGKELEKELLAMESKVRSRQRSVRVTKSPRANTE